MKRLQTGTLARSAGKQIGEKIMKNTILILAGLLVTGCLGEEPKELSGQISGKTNEFCNFDLNEMSKQEFCDAQYDEYSEAWTFDYEEQTEESLSALEDISAKGNAQNCVTFFYCACDRDIPVHGEYDQLTDTVYSNDQWVTCFANEGGCDGQAC